MSNINFSEPDYQYWSKLETWSLNQAAFLLHGINPRETSGVRLGETQVPLEFAPVKDTYSILRSIPWNKKYPDDYFHKLGVRPLVIIAEARARKLLIPKTLYEVFADHHAFIEKSAGNAIKTDAVKQFSSMKQANNVSENDNKSLTKRERKNLLMGIAVLVKLLTDVNKKTKLSALQILEMMKNKASELGIEYAELGSFDRKIAEANKLLDENSSSFK